MSEPIDVIRERLKEIKAEHQKEFDQDWKAYYCPDCGRLFPCDAYRAAAGFEKMLSALPNLLNPSMSKGTSYNNESFIGWQVEPSATQRVADMRAALSAAAAALEGRQ